jgi:hypothetical protein
MWRVATAALLAIVLLGVGGGVALAVVDGKTVSVTAVPWTVVIWEKSPYAGLPPYPACTGVVTGPQVVLTAGHCVMSGNSARLLPDSSIGVEAGTSNFDHPSASDHPQVRAVSAVRVMPGYMAVSKITTRNFRNAVAHDVAVLRLSRPLNLRSGDVRAASLPNPHSPPPSRTASFLIAGFGVEKPTAKYPNGTLNEVGSSRVLKSCTTRQILCVYTRTNPCSGDSGSGAVELGRVPTVVGILSLDGYHCHPGPDYFDYLAAPATLKFIKASSSPGAVGFNAKRGTPRG